MDGVATIYCILGIISAKRKKDATSLSGPVKYDRFLDLRVQALMYRTGMGCMFQCCGERLTSRQRQPDRGR